jgi:hypothetical protein
MHMRVPAALASKRPSSSAISDAVGGRLASCAAEAISARRSQQAPFSVPAEVTRDLIRPPKQLAVALVLQDLVAIEGILKSFQLHLQTLYTRLQRLQPLL